LIAERKIPVEVVGGVEAAGIPHSAALGFSMRLPSVFIRKELKEHGTKKRVEGGDVTGRRVVLVEDLVTTGSSSIAAVEALRAEGAVVTDCLAIISYNFPEAAELFEKADIRLHAATTFQAVLESELERKMIDAAGAAVVLDWLEEPHSWAKRHGFE
jgi:orotate phosphoribosyltransferase